MSGRLQQLLRLPPRVALRRVAGFVAGRIASRRQRRLDATSSSFGDTPTPAPLANFLTRPELETLRRHAWWADAAAREILAHRFDLLGSGPVSLRQGNPAKGVEGHKYEGPVDTSTAAFNNANRAEVARIAAMISDEYEPIDWHRDFKSGYRWSAAAWYMDVPYGHEPGVDIKVPWELARMQHLPQLVWAHLLADHDNAPTAPSPYRDEFRNQLLDFIAHNPPRFGVNWRCAMDVAIRAANWAVSHDLARAAGMTFEPDFEAELQRSLLAHARHIHANLEWDPEFRANHYLANIAGLLITAAYLPPTAETDAWLDFAWRELDAEIVRQFHADGTNFEASTAYHRLSAEMALYGAAYGQALMRRGRIAAPLSAAAQGRLGRMAVFMSNATKPDGRMVQIGDNDSGRFLKLFPAYKAASSEAEAPSEDHLDPTHLLAAFAGILEAPVPGTPPDDPETAIVAALAEPFRLPAAVTEASEITAAEVPAGGIPILDLTIAPQGLDLAPVATPYPDFGLFIFRAPGLFLSIRCGPIGINGRGAHAHNDQLAVELNIDGVDWFADPGSYLYTPAPAERDAYRSVRAHFAPHVGEREPGSLDLGPFWLGDEAKARVLAFGEAEFVGMHEGFGAPVVRRVWFEPDAIRILDTWHDREGDIKPARPTTLRSARDAARFFSPPVPFSPGYGLQDAGRRP